MNTNRDGYMKNIEEMKTKKAPKRWCEYHPTARWDEGYSQCVQGKMKDEVCREGKQD